VEKEKLASVGIDIDEKDYCSTNISSLPFSLANFASLQLASARLYAPSKMIAPNSLISLIAEESECQKGQHSHWQGGKSKDDNKDEAMSIAFGSSKRKGGKWKKRRPHGICWNCGEEGHYKDKCPKPEKIKEKGKGNLLKGKGSANTAVESDLESEGTFVMFDSDGPELESATDYTDEDNLGIPDLESVTNLMDDDNGLDNTDLEEGDWFSEIGDNEDLNKANDKDLEGANETGSVFVAKLNPGNVPIQAEVYDSGCTKHISPYCDDLENFTDIPP
jgi:Zinc knuckle